MPGKGSRETRDTPPHNSVDQSADKAAEEPKVKNQQDSRAADPPDAVDRSNRAAPDETLSTPSTGMTDRARPLGGDPVIVAETVPTPQAAAAPDPRTLDLAAARLTLSPASSVALEGDVVGAPTSRSAQPAFRGLSLRHAMTADSSSNAAARSESGPAVDAQAATARAITFQGHLAPPDYGTHATNTLRLWSAKATEEMNLKAFNQDNYFAAVEGKLHSENVSRVLYPDDSTASGCELRLRQEYFFCSASLQDLLHRYLRTHQGFDALADKISIHLNDTHPVLAVPELMRLLVDEHGVAWATAWALTQRVFSYTNHTLMHEALETWPVDMLGRVLPRHLQIIFDINAGFLKQLTERNGHDVAAMRRLSLIDEQGERRVRMAYLAVVASHSINGVSELHSQLMRGSIDKTVRRKDEAGLKRQCISVRLVLLKHFPPHVQLFR